MENYFENSILKDCKSNMEIIKKVYDNALENRPVSRVLYRPLTKFPFIDMINKPGANLKAIYPESKAGDYAYITSCMDGLFEREMVINLRNCKNPEVWFNGEKVEVTKAEKPSGTLDAKVFFKKGRNSLVIRVSAEDEGFEVVAVPFIPELRMIPYDYVYCTWQYILKEGFRLQDGVEISRLYKKNEVPPSIENIEWVFPKMPKQTDVKTFDFYKLCESGNSAYVYTNVCGKIRITHQSPIKICKDKECIYSAEKGVFETEFNSFSELFIKSIRNGDIWGFYAETEGEHSLSFVDGADCSDLQWMWIGPFGKDTDPANHPYAPEFRLQFDEPYPTACGPVYWNFYRENTVLIQRNHSIFYGQWFYPFMVGMYGMKQAAECLEDDAFYDYYMGGIGALCNHRNYSPFDTARGGYSTYLPVSREFNNLDSIGTMGINIAEYFMMTGDCKAEYMLELLSNSILHNIPRFSDETFNRRKTMWTDDMYMSLPFLVRLGVIKGEKKYFDEIITQVRGFKERLYMEDQHIFSHIFFVEEDKANRVPWGRGNGWVLLALSEVLLLMPETYEGYDEILALYRDFAKGILSFRDREKGFWHQVINNPESYMETSGSAMFITALSRGVRKGWIENMYFKDILEAWNGLCKNCIDSDGNVYGVCEGSGCNMEEKYYLELGTIVNDDHGVGIVLGAGAEIINMTGR